MTIESYLTFLSIAFIATVTPGPAILLAISNTLQYGLLKTLSTILGNISGLFIMSLISVLGLSTLIIHSYFTFSLIKYLGAAYLVYMGINIWRKGLNITIQAKEVKRTQSTYKLYLQGLLVALTNPKAILFTTALFPQFISVQENLVGQFSLLVISFMALSAGCLFAYVAIAAKYKQRLYGEFSHTWLNRTLGSFFIGAGAYLASSK